MTVEQMLSGATAVATLVADQNSIALDGDAVRLVLTQMSFLGHA
jgi:hypothetical protein